MPSAMTFIDVVLGLVFLLILVRLVSRRKGSLPPGPRGLPLLGNVLDMPTQQGWLTFTKWAEKYGDLMSVTLLGQPIIIIGSLDTAIDLLDKKIYSDRPHLEMGSNLVGFGKLIGLMPYGDTLRENRRLLQRTVGTRSSATQFFPMIELQSHRFLRRILDSPDKVAAHIRHTAGAIIMKICYGYDVRESNDPFVDLVDRTMDHFSAISQPGAFLVDIIPILKYVPSWFPGAEFKRKAALWRKDFSDTVNVPYEFVKTQMASGTAEVSFVSSLLEDEELTQKRRGLIKWAASGLYTGGADTTVSSIYTFFLAMTLHPEIQKKAQAEIDMVVGSDRLPEFTDREQLPYVNAVVSEVLRWYPIGPLAIPHRVMEDDVYNGYFIPKGSVVIPNIWKLTHDPVRYNNPMEFNPSRFLATEGKAPELDPSGLVFGFGRRSCPGMYMADASVFMSCVSTLAAFDISKVLENGVEVEPSIEYTTGTVSHPKPFKCSIKPRSSQADNLIRTADERA